MNDFYPVNAAIIARRWPAVFACLEQQDINSVNAELVEGRGSTLSVNGIQLTSRHDREREAMLCANSVPENEKTVFLYGTGLGDIQRCLLQRKKLKQLHVTIMNVQVFALVLHLLDQRDWLDDDKVSLALESKDNLIFLPYICLASELELADEQHHKLRDRLLIQSKSILLNRHFSAQAPWLVERLNSNIELLTQDLDVRLLFNTLPQGEAYVIASGPTLMRHYAMLREVRNRSSRPLLICVDTAFKPLLDNGVVPDVVVSIDKNIHNDILQQAHSENIALVYMPMVRNEVLTLWKGPRYAALEVHDGYASLRSKVKKATLVTNGSVLHPATDLAVQMGAQKITFFGADFSFPGGRTHAEWQDGALGPNARFANRQVLNGHGEPVPTLFAFCVYLNQLEIYISQHPDVSFFNACRDGAMIHGTRYVEELAHD